MYGGRAEKHWDLPQKETKPNEKQGKGTAKLGGKSTNASSIFFFRNLNKPSCEEVKMMAYSSESFMVSEKEAKKIRLKEIMAKERREKLKLIFDRYLKAKREAKG